MELRLPAIKGIGGAPLYLIDRFEDGQSIQLAGVPLMTAPNDIYYEMLAQRLPDHGQAVAVESIERHQLRRGALAAQA